jgi:hypothetical protein
MGGTLGKKKTVIALKTGDIYSRSEQGRHKEDTNNSHASIGSFCMETPPMSPRQGSAGKAVQREVSSSQEVVSRVDVYASSKLRYPKKRDDMKLARKAISTNIIQKPRVHRSKPLVFSEQLVVENVHPEDPYDNLARKHFERRSSVVESPVARTGTMKLLKPKTRRRASTELSKQIKGLPELVKEVRAAKAELMPQESLGEYLGLRRLEELTPHSVEGDMTPSRGTMYRLTHRRLVSQKDVKSPEVQWHKLNSKRAERVWQWRGAFGSLAKLPGRVKGGISQF